jgi:soluble lytic murein transglycosylase-like protein
MLKYHLIKDILLLLIIAAIGACGWKAYNHYTEKIKDFEMSLTKIGTGISIDNQRKAKIQKAAEMIKSVNDSLPYEIAMNYAEWFVDEADKYPNVDFVLLIAIASQESAFNYKALSPTGAKGLMQLIPTTAMDMCEYLRMSYNDTLLYDPKTNIRLGARYVNQMMTYFNNVEHTISAYNAGPGGASRYKLFKAGLLGKESVAEENLKYVPAVLAYKSRYEKLL